MIWDVAHAFNKSVLRGVFVRVVHAVLFVNGLMFPLIIMIINEVCELWLTSSWVCLVYVGVLNTQTILS